jgi:ubiquinone/menaquinone biosynthesis C-methylase UbiE
MAVYSITDDLLRTLHQRLPGATPQGLRQARLADGRASYDLLLDSLAIAPQNPQQILDLGCGDGCLLQRLAKRCAPGSQLWGIDLSDAELHRAQPRLQAVGATLIAARAQQLPLKSATLDIVSCHMALMLLAPLAPAITEIHRVLKPGGQFVALTAKFQPNMILSVFNQVFISLQPAIPPAFATLQQIGAQTTDPATLPTLFQQPTAPFDPVTLQYHQLQIPAQVAEITHFFQHTYMFAILTDQQQADFNQAFPAALTELYATQPDPTPLIIDLQLLTAIRR